jgi:hypothetical protein
MAFRSLYFFSLILYGAYLTLDAFLVEDDVLYFFIRLGLFILFLIGFLYLLTEKFLVNYYKQALFILLLGVITKCGLDWGRP